MKKQLCGSATVFVVEDVLQAVAHYRDALGFGSVFTYGEPTFYAGVGRGAKTLGAPQDYDYGMRDFTAVDPDGNELNFGMESKK